jgi:hypothetical protein
MICGTLAVGESASSSSLLSIATSGTGALILDGGSTLAFNLFGGYGLGNNTSTPASADLLSVGDLDVLNEQARPLQARHAGKLQRRLVDAESANDVAGSLVEDVGRHLVVPLRLRA